MKKIEGWVTAPQGFIAAGVKAGIKASGNHDVAVIFSTVPAACGAVFTQNKMCAAPVLVSREVNKHGYAQAIAVNSGCANACTGEQGLADAKKMQAHTAELLGIAPEAVLLHRCYRPVPADGQAADRHCRCCRQLGRMRGRKLRYGDSDYGYLYQARCL